MELVGLDWLTFGAKIAWVARQILNDGIMGSEDRWQEYAEFIRPLFDPKYPDRQIVQTRTSCGIFAGAVLHWAGRTRKRYGKIGGALLGNWVEDCVIGGKAWHWRGDGTVPGLGSIVYWDYGMPRRLSSGRWRYQPTTGSHVSVLMEQVGDLWLCAAGGGNDDDKDDDRSIGGTVCKIGHHPIDVFAPDGLHRNMIGWFEGDELDLAA